MQVFHERYIGLGLVRQVWNLLERLKISDSLPIKSQSKKSVKMLGGMRYPKRKQSASAY